MKLYKKSLLLLFAILMRLALFAGGGENLYLPEDKIYIEFEVDGQKIGKWLFTWNIKEYDVKGRLLRETSYSSIDEYKYHGDGKKPIYMESTSGDYSHRYLWEYDSKSNVIYHRGPDGGQVIEEWYEYDKYGNVIYSKEESDGTWFTNYEYKYDSNNKVIYEKRSGYMDIGNGKEYPYEKRFWYEYDSSGNKLHELDSDGNESWYEYNESGWVIYSKSKSKAGDGSYYNSQTWCEYDENGNITVKREDQTVYVHRLEYYEDGTTLKKDTCYFYEKN